MRTSVTKIQALKHQKPIVMITAYDALFAKLFDEEVDIILVGDSLNMSFGGHEDTITKLDLNAMMYHAKAVARGAKQSLIVLDMPFGTYPDAYTAFKNASRAMRGCDITAVKIEGGTQKAPIIKHLVDNSIPVMGHIGLLPQSVRSEGGYKVKGKDQDNAKALIEDALAVQEAGAFALVCEGIKTPVATQIAQAVRIPVIGIGAGNGVDGQVLVWSDMLGLFEDFKPKFCRSYLDGANVVRQAVRAYAKDIRNGDFPSEAEGYN